MIYFIDPSKLPKGYLVSGSDEDEVKKFIKEFPDSILIVHPMTDEIRSIYPYNSTPSGNLLFVHYLNGFKNAGSFEVYKVYQDLLLRTIMKEELK